MLCIISRRYSIFYEDALPVVFPIDSGENASDNEDNESIAEGVNNPNNDPYPTLYVEVPSYQVQNMNVN